MVLSYHAGRRIQGTSTDKANMSIPNLTSGVGGWVELGRTTLGSASSTIDVSNFPSKRYLTLLIDGTPTGAVYHQGRFNNDNGTSYANRRRWNNNADSPLGDRTLLFEGGNSTTTRHFDVHFISNFATKNKLTTGQTVYEGGDGATVVPHREEFNCKWVNNTDVITRYTEVPQIGNLATGAEVVVLGYDPTDTHTTNFWEELTSKDFTGSSNSITTDTFATKKYLWVQVWAKGSASLRPSRIQFNGDGGNSYAMKRWYNGTFGGDFPSIPAIAPQGGHNTTHFFANMFILNKPTLDKLVNMHVSELAGSSSTTVPDIHELAAKWDNPAQINSVTLSNDDSGTLTNAVIKVWGAN